MPTAAKLVAALVLAAVAYLASDRAVALLMRDGDFTVFRIVNTVLGAVVGWRVTGRDVDGVGRRRAASAGVFAIAVLLFWAVLGYAAREMLIRATQLRYADPLEALEAMVVIAMDYTRFLRDPQLAAILLAGGVAAGLAAQAAARRWR